MKETTIKERSIAQLIKVIVWGQVVGHLCQVGGVIFQDAPDYLARTSIASILVPILILIAMHVFKLDLLFARVDPGWLFIALGLILSGSMTAMAFQNVQYYFDLPESMITSSWHYGQIASVISFTVFGIGLIFTIWFSIRVFRSQ
jgi:hypothetical protein